MFAPREMGKTAVAKAPSAEFPSTSPGSNFPCQEEKAVKRSQILIGGRYRTPPSGHALIGVDQFSGVG
jgi:hypothetical protein